MKSLKIILVSFLVFFITSCHNQKIRSTYNIIPTARPSANIVDSSLMAEDVSLSGYNDQFIQDITQRFKAASINSTVIKCRSGLKISINPALLEKEDGSAIDGMIEVAVIELINSDDLFKSNAATVSNGKLLASGGSYYIGMVCNSQKLRIRKGCSLKVNFPFLSPNEMELFYGQRDNLGNMNWKKSGKVLQPDNEITFSDKQNFANISKPSTQQIKLYDSLNSQVYFYDRKMTIKDFVDTLQKRGVDISIDTLYMNYNCEYCAGRYKQYRIITGVERKREKERLEELNRLMEAQREQQENNSLAGQVKRYYAATTIGSLGWINCDRFYNEEMTDINLGIPITMSNRTINYFIIFKSFNGLVNGKIRSNDQNKFSVTNLPLGQAITIVAFTRNNGQLFQCSKDYIIHKNSSFSLDFKPISNGEMSKMFAANIKI